MKKFNGTETGEETLSSAAVLSAALEESKRYAQYVGLDVHKDTIAVALSAPGRGEPRYDGEIAHTPKAVKKLVQLLSADAGGEQMLWCYEAGPCGYGLYRLLLSLGQACEVVAPRAESGSRPIGAMH